MTLIVDLDPDILKMYPHTKNEVSRSMLSSPNTTYKQTNRRDWMHYHAAFKQLQ